ncbi:helix-turn-helix transcriptional regulator [Aestuariibacter salexigens]|uniref:helix-turn-helix transcriptional regulator n=1 Tax=Aestuariibacter salexigens TaxID=226010 RepID=UPI000415DC07|nr:helix-turn-helix domain-containing protein [Aestuariibacter salexigens]
MPASFHSALIFILILAWLLPLVTIWVRYDSLRHAKIMWIAVLLWPLMLVDEAIKSFDSWSSLVFISGAFQFIPALLALLMFYALHSLLLKAPFKQQALWLFPVALMAILQVPFLILPAEFKTMMLNSPPIGDPLGNWSVYLLTIGIGFMMLVAGLRSVDLLQRYQFFLSDLVVDVHLYKLPMLMGWFAIQVCLAFGMIIFTVLIALGLLPFEGWKSTFNLAVAAYYLGSLMLMLQRRRYATSSVNYAQLIAPKFNQTLLQDTLLKAESAVIQHKAYKKIGLRIDQLAKVADVDPTALAVATRTILNRNFRAFIYHYRLEYAKKVLMQTDAKVSAVARRLGFNSEKFLSNMFIKYIQQMSNESLIKEERDADPFSSVIRR